MDENERKLKGDGIMAEDKKLMEEQVRLRQVLRRKIPSEVLFVDHLGTRRWSTLLTSRAELLAGYAKALEDRIDIKGRTKELLLEYVRQKAKEASAEELANLSFDDESIVDMCDVEGTEIEAQS